MKAKLLSIYLYLILTIILVACNQYWHTIVVKQGNHSCNDLSKMILNCDEIKFQFRTNNSWYYKAPENPGWNKIRGFSFGQHQNNSSARLGYQCLNDSVLVVGAYCYVDGVSPQENPDYKAILDTIMPGKVYTCTIKRENDNFVFYFGDKTWMCPAGKNQNWGYLLNPYIGGTFTLDHDWIVDIKDK